MTSISLVINFFQMTRSTEEIMRTILLGIGYWKAEIFVFW